MMERESSWTEDWGGTAILIVVLLCVLCVAFLKVAAWELSDRQDARRLEQLMGVGHQAPADWPWQLDERAEAMGLKESEDE